MRLSYLFIYEKSKNFRIYDFVEKIDLFLFIFTNIKILKGIK